MEPQPKRPLRVLFVNPPSVPYSHLVKGLANRFSSLDQIVAMPMGILYLAAVLERDHPGAEIRIVDLAKAVRGFNNQPDRQELDIQDFTAAVLQEELPADFEPDFIGISILFSTAHKTSLEIARALKRRWPGVQILIGGMHATNAVSSLLDCEAVDYVCRGEAEAIISQVAERVLAGRELNLPGVIGRKTLAEDPNRALTESAPLIADLDEIPLPAWHLLHMPEYLFANVSRARRLDQIKQDGEATIVTTRGCPFRCSFCSSWTVHGRNMRYRSVDNVLEELTILKQRYGVVSVIPEDDLFTVQKARILALCEAVADQFGRSLHFQFPNGLSVATLDEDVIRALVKMGMSLANIAIESGSPHVQRHIIKKNCNLSRARDVVEACRREGIFVRAYFILGFPGETRDLMRETVDFARSLPTDWSVFNVAAPLIGTEMYQQMLDEGWIDQTFNWDETFFQERAFDTPEIGAQELKDLAYSANIDINYFNNYNLRIGEYDRAISLFQDVLRSYHGHLVAQYCIGLAKRAKDDHSGHAEALMACQAMLAGDYPLAHLQMKQYGALMPELLETQVPAPEVDPKGPRPGMPFRARLNM